ncbi:MAG: ABC transporter ATP-binding protein [Clostridium sp.]
MSYLKINNIRKSFKKNEVLKGINIEINKGELICFLGPSGCGKTTLLRIIAGLETNDSGSVMIEGRDITKLAPSKRNIGIVFQNYALFPNLTIFDNVAYGLVNKKVPKNEIKERVMEMLDMVGLSNSADKYPSEISGGMQQRVALARAIILKPDILLLDEPLSALDAKVRESLRSEIKNLQQKLNITTILVTHDQEEALTMGDKIIVFNNGNVMREGNPEEIYYDPQNEFTADFIGKINFVTNKDGSVEYLRPECIDYSLTSKDGYSQGLIKDIEFRGNIFRITAVLENNKEEVFLDISWKEKNDNNLKVGKYIYLKIEEGTEIKRYA